MERRAQFGDAVPGHASRPTCTGIGRGRSNADPTKAVPPRLGRLPDSRGGS